MKKMHPAAIKALYAVLGLVVLTLAACAHRGPSAGESVQRISKEELKPMLGDPGVTVIDVRSKRDWEGSDVKIPGAVRQNPSTKDLSWAEAYDRGRSIVLYCA